MAVANKGFSNCNALQKPNCSKLLKTIPNIMPFDIGTNYKMKYHQVPSYLQAACVPFSQELFSLESYDLLRYSSFETG